jgi:hypothetical protein
MTDIIAALKRIAESLESQAPTDKLWSIDDIAAYSQHHRNEIYKLKDRPDFPRPIMVTKHPRYEPEEIKAYFKTKLRA